MKGNYEGLVNEEELLEIDNKKVNSNQQLDEEGSPLSLYSIKVEEDIQKGYSLTVKEIVVAGEKKDDVEVKEKAKEQREGEKEKKEEEKREVKEESEEEKEEAVEVYFEYFDKEFTKIQEQIEKLSKIAFEGKGKSKEQDTQAIINVINNIEGKLKTLLKGSEEVAKINLEKLSDVNSFLFEVMSKTNEELERKIDKKIGQLKLLIYFLIFANIGLVLLLVKLLKKF